MKKDQKFSIESEFWKILQNPNLDSNRKCKWNVNDFFGCYVNANKNFAIEFWVTSIRKHLLVGAEQ